QQYGAILPIELTTAEIRNSKAYKEYHAYTMGEAAPKPKASARKKKGDSASSTTPPTPPPTTTVESAPWLQETHISQQSGSGTDEGTGSKPGVLDVPSDDSEEELEEEEESFDPIPRTPEESEEERIDAEEQDLRLTEEARIQEEEDADELYRDVNINQGRGL
nr:hypothetical protein [Tanacetum cinerariifolium]